MRSTIPLFLAASLMAGGTLSGNEIPATQEKTEATKSANDQTTVPTTQNTSGSSEYKIGPQDVLQIDVWKEPELTRLVPVRPDGKITLPLLSDVQATGLTPMELAGVIRDELKKYINNPQVTVSISVINSRRVYVTGEVTRPGAFPLLPDMTVLQALTSAGGFTQFAKLKGIYVLRMEGGKQIRHLFHYKDVITGKRSEDNIQLQPGDTIVVP